LENRSFPSFAVIIRQKGAEWLPQGLEQPI
jgi:hypothetical protein